jgi:hypothetical protein
MAARAHSTYHTTSAAAPCLLLLSDSAPAQRDLAAGSHFLAGRGAGQRGGWACRRRVGPDARRAVCRLRALASVGTAAFGFPCLSAAAAQPTLGSAAEEVCLARPDDRYPYGDTVDAARPRLVICPIPLRLRRFGGCFSALRSHDWCPAARWVRQQVAHLRSCGLWCSCQSWSSARVGCSWHTGRVVLCCCCCCCGGCCLFSLSPLSSSDDSFVVWFPSGAETGSGCACFWGQRFVVFENCSSCVRGLVCALD